ncbi:MULTISPECIES: cupin domain-containing protein [Brevibacterium]|mgnify:CR=1 FL=1|uniref:Cupin domain-containing protein n=1 Tax=Brevibacterium salitolerans TaxID=1403566 RepID=A0ABN2WNF5_9MICO|nr:cupin domain-containing protein [Brevibacterium sp.]
MADDAQGLGSRPIDVLAAAPAPDPQRRNGRPSVKRLLQGDGANLIAFTFVPGQSLPEHTAAHPITVQCLSGTLTFTCEGQTTVLTPGTIVHCRAHVEHRVDCPAGEVKPASGAEATGRAAVTGPTDAASGAEAEAAASGSVLLLTMLTGERH